MTDRLIRITTAAAVATVAAVAAVISYRHACELAGSHGETGVFAAELDRGLSASASTRASTAVRGTTRE